MSEQIEKIQKDNRQEEPTSHIIVEKFILEPGMKLYSVTIEKINGSRFYGISEITESRKCPGILIPVNAYRQFRVLIDENIRKILNFKLRGHGYDYGLAYTPTLNTEDGRSYYINFYVEGGTVYVIFNQIKNGSIVFVTIDWSSLQAFHLAFHNSVEFFKNEPGYRIYWQNFESSDYSSSDCSSSYLSSGDSTLSSEEDDSEWNEIWPSVESESTSIDSD